jgi:Flp pilus assembly protein TadD
MSETLSRYQILLDGQPANELLHFSVGRSLFKAGRFPEAEIHLLRALTLKPKWMVAAMLLAQCASKRNDLVRARHFYELALPLAVSEKHEGPEQEIREALAVLREMEG